MEDLRLLRSFVEVAQSGSMAEAAQVLYCTAPAISQQISRLEAELGAKVFVRSNQGVQLTNAGKALLDKCSEIFMAMADLPIIAKEASEQEDIHVRLTAFSSAAIHLLPSSLRAFRSRYPSARLSLSERHDDFSPFERLTLGDVDVVITHEYDHVPLQIPESVTAIRLGDDPMDIALPASHPLAAKSRIKLSELALEEWILFPPDNIATISTLRECADAGFEPRSSFTVSDTQVMWSLVEAGMGIALLPRLVTSSLTSKHLSVRRVHKAHSRTLLVGRRKGEKSAVIASLVNDLKKSFI